MKLLTLAELHQTLKPMHLSNEELVRILYSYRALCVDYPGVEAYDFRGPRETRDSLVCDNLNDF